MKRLIIILLGIICFASCKTAHDVEYADREVVKYVKSVETDTLIVNTHDSVWVSEKTSGDTIFLTKYVWKEVYRDKVVNKIDTCYQDSIQIETQEKIVEKKIIPKWCYYSLVVCFLFIIFAIVKVVRWLR